MTKAVLYNALMGMNQNPVFERWRSEPGSFALLQHGAHGIPRKTQTCGDYVIGLIQILEQ